MERFVRGTSEPWTKYQESIARAYREAEALPTYRALITKHHFGAGRVVAGSPSGAPASAPTRFWLAAQLGNAQIALALKAYEAEHGTYPDSLASLELAGWKLPQDPFTGKALYYRREGQGFVIYSLGADMKDQGGQPRSEYDIPFRCSR